MSTTPNVLLIHTHDTGQYLGCYGADVETPNVDELAASGVRFENHYTTAPQCSPSRASLQTGNYPTTHGMMGLAHDGWELGDDQTTMPEYLADRGYETHLFGLQHITTAPERLGYETIHSGQTLSPDTSPGVHQAHRARGVADDVAEFLEEDPADGPFFASVGFFEAHRIKQNGTFVFDDPAYDADDPEEFEPLPFLPDKPGIRRDLADMRGMIRAIDDGIGTITDALERTRLEDETLVVFTTEHGLAFPRAKGTCYDSGIEAFLLLRLPGTIDGGTTYEELVSNVDVLPTILDLVDGSIPEDVEGRSFLPLLTGESYNPRRHLFAEMTWHDQYNPIRAIRTPRYKYVRNFWPQASVHLMRDVLVCPAGRDMYEEYFASFREREELYDLRSDPLEQHDVSDDPEYENVRAELEEHLREHMAATDDPLRSGPVVPPNYDEIVPEQFRST